MTEEWTPSAPARTADIDHRDTLLPTESDPRGSSHHAQDRESERGDNRLVESLAILRFATPDRPGVDGRLLDEPSPSPRGSLVGIPLLPTTVALEESGYALRGSGPDAITCALGSLECPLGEVTRLSPTAIWVIPRGPVTRAETPTLSIFLAGRGTTIGPLVGAFVRTDAEAAGGPICIELLGVTLNQGRQILALLADALRDGVAEPAPTAGPVQDLIEQPERVRALLCASSNTGVLRRRGRAVPVVLERFDTATSQLEWRTEEPRAAWGEAPYDVELIGYNSVYRMRLEAAGLEGDRLVTPVPARIVGIRHRWQRRIPVPAGVRVRFRHPLWRELGELQRDAVDLSSAGLCIRCTPDDLMFPGLEPNLELETGDGQVLALRAEIRYVTSPRADGHVLCGLRVQPHAVDEVRWVRFVSQLTSPATRTSEAIEHGMWDLFTHSGFFSLAGRSTAEFEELRQDFRTMAKRGAELPQLFCQAVWPSERGPEATLSFVKAYRQTWLLHQLAKRPAEPPPGVQRPGQILRDLYLRTFEHAQSDPELRWAVAYVEATNPWLENAHVRFAERHMATAPGLAFTRQIHMLDVLTHEHTGRSHEGIHVGPATPEELTLLAETIARTRPDCYVEALDFTRDRIDMRPVQARWQHVGLEREREILIARRGGVPIAATVLELGQRGTNLFCLLDAARLFSLTEDGPSTYVALADAARHWYAARRRTSFHFLCEDEGGDYVEEAGIHRGPSPFMWLISATLIPDYLEHISELTFGRAWRPQPSSTRPEVQT